MNLATVFQISIYSLTAMSGAMLAFGEETPFPSGLTVFLAVLALFFNERYRIVRLNLLFCNALGLAAFAMSIYESLQDRPDAKLLGGAHFLVYLVWIVLFKDKQPGQYWWFFAMGLLQVAVGAVMTLSGWYGAFLVLYLILALWTMAVFHLYRRALTFGDDGTGRLAAASSALEESARPVSSPEAPAPRPAQDGRRTIVEDSVQQDRMGRWITPRFTFGVIGISLAGLALGLVMFLLVPRVWLEGGNPLVRTAHAMNGATTGFSSTVSLGHLGQILESNDKVFELRLFDDDSDKPMRLEEFTRRHGSSEPLFRGIVLDTYEGARWSNHRVQGHISRMRTRGPIPGMVRQEYVIDPSGSRVIFSMRPIGMGKMIVPPDVLDIDPETHTLSTHIVFQERLKYQVYSKPLPLPADGQFADRDGRYSGQFSDLPRIPGQVENRDDEAAELYLKFPPTGLEQLRRLARDWTVSERLTDNAAFSEERRRALTIESRLRDSGEFTYTLNMTVQDPKRDPIEDFLFNRKSGHCEYYASALAMMLRAVDIPSRLVTGYKGAERAVEGDHYEVRQHHAHAWVEAYVDSEWLALDATPGDRDVSLRQMRTNGDFWRTAKSSLSELWSTYIVSMSYNRQKESMYDPLTGTMSGGYASFSEFLQSVLERATEIQNEVIPSGPLSLAGLALIGGFLVIVVASVRLGRRVRVRLQALRRSTVAPSRWRLWWRGWLTRWCAPILGPRIIVEFYEQFLGLVSLRGLSPASHQTQREFARQVEESLADTLGADGLATLPREVTGLYCRVRFGGDILSPDEIDHLGNRIRRLAVSLQGK